MVITNPKELEGVIGSRGEFEIASRSVHLEDGSKQTLSPGTFPSMDKFFPEAAASNDKIEYGPKNPIPAEEWGAQLMQDAQKLLDSQKAPTVSAPAATLPSGPGGM